MKTKMLLGWKEYCALPRLRIPLIAAKIDTGAHTSCLHAFEIEPYLYKGQKYVKFMTHPKRLNDDVTRSCNAPVVDYRIVRSSNGEHEYRYIIETELLIGGSAFIIDISLTNRMELNFRMLLGRQFLREHSVIDVSLCLNQGKPHKEFYDELVQKRKKS